MLTAALIASALLAGIAGSWSPCGLSMIETLGRRPGATLTFTIGSLAGGAVTFGGLAFLGTALFGPVVAGAVAALLVAALGDAAGRRIVPQVRRQVPESFRRVLPLPLATGIYGILLGLGFTTFLLTYATWALAAACLAVGAPETGLAVGLAFGAGRAAPVVLLPHAEVLGERPELLRGLRAGVAAALIVAAALLTAAPPAARAAAALYVSDASDPSANGGLVAYQPQAGNGVLVRRGEMVTLPGRHPAVAANRVAWIADNQIHVADAATLAPLALIAAPGANALALSATHVAWRSGRRLRAVALAATTVPPRLIAAGAAGEVIGRPTLDGDDVLFDLQSRTRSRLFARNADSGVSLLLRQTRGAQLLHPTRAANRLLFVRATANRQQLVLGSSVIYSTTPTARRDKGHEPGLRNHHEGYRKGRRPPRSPRPPKGVVATLWTTALDRRSAYVTRLRHRRGGRTDARILRVRF